jgi:sialate O-acetylesterase
MQDGTMFHDLHGYYKKDYWQEHQFIQFDTLYERHTYQIIAVFKTSANLGEGYAYHQFNDAANEEEFNEFVRTVKNMSFYNTGVDAQYGDMLITLVTRWRELFGDAELPFYNVQLPMHIDAGAQDDGSWARLRQAQEKAWKALRNSYLAVMLDAGEYGNIHPVDKVTPGTRLARLFLGDDETPRALAKSTQGGILTVELTRPVHGEPDLFEVAGEDGAYVPAKAELDGCRIRLSAEGVAHPVKARYAWVNYAKVSVFGENGLPLAPFCLKD